MAPTNQSTWTSQFTWKEYSPSSNTFFATGLFQFKPSAQLCCNFELNQRNLSPSHTGPFEVEVLINSVFVRLKLPQNMRMWNIPVETHLVQFVVTPPTIWIIDGQLAYTVRRILVVSVQKLLREIWKDCLKRFLWEKMKLWTYLLT